MNSNANIKLADDITLPASWTPAGGTVSASQGAASGDYPKVDISTDNPFTGILDGNNHSITVTVVDEQFANGAWTGTLFAAVENAAIKSLTLNATINNSSTTANIAGIAGISNGSTYENVTVTGSNTSYRPSGITCYSVDDNFQSCEVSMALTAQCKSGKSAIVGGLAQQISGTSADTPVVIENCRYSGIITIDAAAGPSSVWAGAMYGGTSYEQDSSDQSIYFPLTVQDCTFSGTLNISNAGDTSVAAYGSWATETSGSKTAYFEGLLGRAHKDLTVTVAQGEDSKTSEAGSLTYSSSAAPTNE